MRGFVDVIEQKKDILLDIRLTPPGKKLHYRLEIEGIRT